ncbi:hypothetical protein HDU91_007288 [Kappamyces sp. JEL0680]|nr:hypothetical protein HDU91_007288 [Kappamyces sp. JEL0680]
MNSDSVAEAMARNLGIRKSEILDSTADNMAVRLALAETNIIAETKKYLEQHDVSLDAFTAKKGPRSNTVILVKNLPSSTSEDDLLQLFGGFGTLGRLVLPPARTIALVEYSERNEAKVAFRKLAYTKFKSVPLYLEWAPSNTFVSEYNPLAAKERETNKAENAVKIAEKPEADQDLAPAATVFVKNLNFDTSDEGLKKAFQGLGGLRSARISTKAAPNHPGKRMSMGFGFLEFESKEDAMKCIKSMQNFTLDGHQLSLKFSTNTATASHSSRKRLQTEAKEDSTKLLVRNLPFEATKKDLKQLFSAFGSLKTVRIPRKFDGQHRGFGFVDFLTPQEAKTAIESLGATHLYGRHLVIEWAKDEESVEEIREKTAKGYVKEDRTKKRRIEMEDELQNYDD